MQPSFSHGWLFANRSKEGTEQVKFSTCTLHRRALVASLRKRFVRGLVWYLVDESVYHYYVRQNLSKLAATGVDRNGQPQNKNKREQT